MTSPARARDASRLDLMWITGAWLAAGLLVRPFQNTPFVDDWVYAWPVERLLSGGDLRVLDYAGSLNPVQVVWGLLFCLPFGFSFSALRVSTWMAGLFGLWALYLLLRDQGVSRRDAFLGTACLGAYPIYFLLSFTFMTDVPVVTCIIWATLAFLRATRRRSDLWLWIAIAAACGAVGIRVVGAVVPAAMSLTLLTESDGWGRRKARALWPMTALVFLALTVWWFGRHVEVVSDLTYIDNAPAARVRLLKEQALVFFPVMAVCATKFLAGTLGLALLPLSAGMIDRPRLLRGLAVMVVLGAVVAVPLRTPLKHPAPLTSGQTWAFEELGATERLVLDYQTPVMPAWWAVLVTAVAIASASVFVSRSVRHRNLPDTFLLLQIVGQFVLITLLWLFYDRYALALLPIVVVMVLRTGPVVRPRATAALVVTVGLLSLVGVRDHLAYNRALWGAVQHLWASGVRPADFDGGYVVNGWLQYAHPEHARRDATGLAEVPNVNTRTQTDFRISNHAPEGWKIVSSFPYTRWAGRSGRVYVLEREG